ncbi:MAG: DNA gyrase subunit A, partial [Duncaniella sp.]|nr:DNA gyrase subunit A [Duncaniella sp.]
ESVNDENDLVIINKSGITLRIHVADIRVQGRATQGVRIINLDKRNDTIASVCCVDSDPEEEVEQVEIQESTPELPEDEIIEIDEIDEEIIDEEEPEETDESDDEMSDE